MRRTVLLITLCTACDGPVQEQGRRMCHNRMQLAATRAESVAVLDVVAYQSALNGETRCGNLDSLPQRR